MLDFITITYYILHNTDGSRWNFWSIRLAKLPVFFFPVRLYFGSDKRRKGLQQEALHVTDQMQEVASFPADAM